VVDVGLEVEVVGALRQGERSLEMVERFRLLTCRVQGAAEAVVGQCLDGGGVEVVGGGQPGLPDHDVVVAVFAAAVEVHQRPGQLPHGVVPPPRGGQLLGCQHAEVLGREPLDGCCFVSDVMRFFRCGKTKFDRWARRRQELVAGVGGVQVKGGQPVQRGFPVGLSLVGAGPVGAVVADQVVHAVPAGGVLVDQGDLCQPTQHRSGSGAWQGGEVGGRPEADVRTRSDGEQPEHSGLLRGESRIRPGQHRGQADRGIIVFQRAQPGLAEILGHGGE
jgi:hypothetical protein